MSSSYNNIIFFDGVCNLCNHAVDFIIRHDQQATFKFAALQSDVAHGILPPDYLALDSIVLWRDGNAVTHSTAALLIGADLFRWGVLIKSLLFIPNPIRDVVYRWIARNRYAWFGKTDVCRLPTEEEQSRFL